MAKFTFLDGNLGFYGYGDLAAYVLPDFDGNQMVLEYDVSQGTLDTTEHAARITFTFSATVSYTIENGLNAGKVRVTDGTLSAIHYENAKGDTLLDVTGLSVFLPVFLQMLNRGDGFAAWQMVTHAPNTIHGSVDASGPGHAGTGDVLDTGTGNDTVYAYGGDDYLKDQGGADLYNGSYGFDTLSYEGWFFKPQFLLRGVEADLALGTVTGPDGLSDRIFGIEAVIGTWRGDTLKGNGFANKFTGLAGVDRIDGRGGFDMVSYAADAGQGGTDGIKANLALGTVRDGFGNTDRLVSIEGVEGTAVRDLFIDSASNTFFDGGAGNDLFVFGSGNDTAIGGRGADLFTFNGTAYDDDTIRDFSPIEGDRINFAAADRFAELHFFAVKVNGVDAVNVQFGSGSVTLLGMTLAGLHAADFGF